MALLLGNVTHGVDAKGRVFIPSKWRDELGSVVILTHGILNRKDIRCLSGMSEDGFRQYIGKFSSLPETDVRLQNFRRLLHQNSTECEMDKQGRILLPAKFREYAALGDEVVLIGMDNRIEIWNGEWLDIHNRDVELNYDDALRELAVRGV